MSLVAKATLKLVHGPVVEFKTGPGVHNEFDSTVSYHSGFRRR